MFATLEPSVAAYHLAFDYADNLYVTAPTTTSRDPVYMIDPDGQISEFYSGLGRPQGIAFDTSGNLYVAASFEGKRGIVRMYIARTDGLVWLEHRTDRPWLITPERPADFVRALAI